MQKVTVKEINSLIKKTDNDKKDIEIKELEYIDNIRKDINAFEIDSGIGKEEIKAAEKHSIFKLLDKQRLYDLAQKKLKCFKLIQKKDEQKNAVRRLTSLRYASHEGVTHLDEKGVRYFCTGVVMFEKILFYKVGNRNYVKVIIHTQTDCYRDGSISKSYLCDENRPYTLESEIKLTEESRQVLLYSVHAIQVLLDDTFLKDLMNYTKNNNKLMLIAALAGLCFGLFLGCIITVLGLTMLNAV